MSTINSYGTSGSAPKGSSDNPYTMEEFESLWNSDTWPGGYVTGLGWVKPNAIVISSFLSSGHGHIWLSGQSSPFPDNWPDNDEDDGGGSGDGSNGNSPSNGNGNPNDSNGNPNNSNGNPNGNNENGNQNITYESSNRPSSIKDNLPPHTPIDKLGAAFAGFSYRDANNKDYKLTANNAKWFQIPLDDFLNGILLQNPLTGLKFSIWEKKEYGRTVAYVCAYAGSDFDLTNLPGILADARTDVNNLLGIMTEQYAQAMAIAIALDLYCKSEGIELTFVGHSLGGGLAALSSMVTGRPAITYNPAAVMALPTLALEKIGRTCDDSNIYKYIMEGDYVTAGQEALGISAWGHRIDVHNSTPKDDAHSIYTMYNNLK